MNRERIDRELALLHEGGQETELINCERSRGHTYCIGMFQQEAHRMGCHQRRISWCRYPLVIQRHR